MGGKPQAPEVPAPTPPPKPQQDVTNAFRQARAKGKGVAGTRGLPGTDITQGLLSKVSLGTKTLLGQ